LRSEYITGVTMRVIKKLTDRPPTKVLPMGRMVYPAGAYEV
jgi:hypothetical protein